MADTAAMKPGSPKKRVTMSAGKDHDHRGGSAGRRTPGTPTGDYTRPVVRSAMRRWKRLHEQNMMEKLVVIRNEKKENVKLSKDDAKKVARKIPIEVLAKDWLNDTEATLEVRAYLVDKVLPTLILGVEKLLNEADKKGLAESGEQEPNFNPINFLAQYLMRNNPRYCNFSESSPYVRGLREVADELKKQLFNIEDNRLARIKAEAKRRREERDRMELLKQHEKKRREAAFMEQFSDWNLQPDGRVELSIVQNALRSFVEIAETFTQELQESAKLSHALESTDETGKAHTDKEFAKYLGMFVEDLTIEMFDEFMSHLSNCATSHRAAASRESRRILLTNLFITCDHSGIGLLDRHRILSLFELYWDAQKEDMKRNLRNPRRWPVAEVDEVVDYFDDDDDDDFDKLPTKQEDKTQQQQESKEGECDPPQTAQTDNTLVTFAEGTAFSREKTAGTHISKTSGASAFDENSLNVSQFVQLTETFLGEDPVATDTFETLTKFVKGGYEETEQEKMDRLMKARKETLSSQRKYQMDSLFEKWDNDGAGYLDMEEVETVMQKYKEGQENQALQRAKEELRNQAKYSHDNRLSRREFRQFLLLVVDELPGADSFDYFVEFLVNSVERTYAERIRGEARKKWLQQVVNAAETGGASLDPVYRAIFNALYKDAEAHGGGKRISANISMLERNTVEVGRGDVCLRYVAATVDDSEYLLGKILFKDMKGISFPSIESGKPVHVPRVNNHGNIQFWNPYRVAEDREGSFIVVPLKDKRKRVFGLLGIDTLNDRHTKTIFITHEIQFFQGVANSFSIAYHHVDMSKKLLRITESAVSWIHRRSPHVNEITTYTVEPDGQEKDYVLRKMMMTDAKGNVVNMVNPARLERKDNLFRDYLFKCVDNSESVSADAYGQRHLGFPLRDDGGKAVALVDISIGELKQLPNHENKEVQRMLRLLQQAHKEITRESAGDEKLLVLEAEKDDDNRMDIMFDRLMLMELRENVSKINSKGFAELRSYNDPPKIINDIVRAVCAVFYYEDIVFGDLDNWGDLKALINSELLQKIEQYDPTSTDALIAPEKIEVFLKDVPHGEVAKFGSIPAQNMYNWVFVCISLIEHTLKMRKNSEEGAVMQSRREEAKDGAAAHDSPPKS